MVTSESQMPTLRMACAAGFVPAPFLVFFYTLFVKGLILDGWPGWYYVLQRTLAETVLSLRLMEARLGVRGEPEL